MRCHAMETEEAGNQRAGVLNDVLRSAYHIISCQCQCQCQCQAVWRGVMLVGREPAPPSVSPFSLRTRAGTPK
jgi:hypothetical protein